MGLVVLFRGGGGPPERVIDGSTPVSLGTTGAVSLQVTANGSMPVALGTQTALSGTGFRSATGLDTHDTDFDLDFTIPLPVGVQPTDYILFLIQTPINENITPVSFMETLLQYGPDDNGGSFHVFSAFAADVVGGAQLSADGSCGVIAFTSVAYFGVRSVASVESLESNSDNDTGGGPLGAALLSLAIGGFKRRVINAVGTNQFSFDISTAPQASFVGSRTERTQGSTGPPGGGLGLFLEDYERDIGGTGVETVDVIWDPPESLAYVTAHIALTPESLLANIAIQVTVDSTKAIPLGTTGAASLQVTVDGSMPVPLLSDGTVSAEVGVTEDTSPITMGTTGEVSVTVVVDSQVPVPLGTTGAVVLDLMVNGSTGIALGTIGDASLQVTVDGAVPVTLGTTGDATVVPGEDEVDVTEDNSPITMGTTGDLSVEVTVDGLSPVTLSTIGTLGEPQVIGEIIPVALPYRDIPWAEKRLNGRMPVRLGTTGHILVAKAKKPSRIVDGRSGIHLGTQGSVQLGQVARPQTRRERQKAKRERVIPLPARVVSGASPVRLGTLGAAIVLPFPVPTPEPVAPSTVLPIAAPPVAVKPVPVSQKTPARLVGGTSGIGLGTKGTLELVVVPPQAVGVGVQVVAETALVLGTQGKITLGTVPPPEQQASVPDAVLLAYELYYRNAA